MSTRSGSEAIDRDWNRPAARGGVPGVGRAKGAAPGRATALLGGPPYWRERPEGAGAHAGAAGPRRHPGPAHVPASRTAASSPTCCASSERGRPLFDVFTLDWRSSNLLFGPAGECLRGPDRPADTTSCYRIDRAAERGPARRAGGGGARCGPGARSTWSPTAWARPPRPRPSPAGASATPTTPHSRRSGGSCCHHRPVLPAGRRRLDEGGGQHRRRAGVARGAEFLSPAPGVRAAAGAVPLARQLRGDVRHLARRALFSHGCQTVLRPALVPLRRRLPGRRHDGHARRAGQRGLDGHFGAMPIGLYRHIVENCRRGWAARWEVSPRTHAYELLRPDRFPRQGHHPDHRLREPGLAPRLHRSHVRVAARTLARPAGPVRKRVFERYGHVDLWWSSQAPTQVFPYLTERAQVLSPVCSSAAAVRR